MKHVHLVFLNHTGVHGGKGEYPGYGGAYVVVYPPVTKLLGQPSSFFYICGRGTGCPVVGDLLVVPVKVFELWAYDPTGGRISVYRSERIPSLYRQRTQQKGLGGREARLRLRNRLGIVQR